jgi:sulfonate transport system permease protein
MKGMVSNMKKLLKPAIAIIVIIFIWYCLCALKIWNTYILPSPKKVLSSAISMLKSGELFINIGISLKRVFIGYGISFVLAFGFGVLGSLYPKATSYYNHLVEFARNVPPISLIPLLILWFGIGETPKLIVIILKKELKPVIRNCWRLVTPWVLPISKNSIRLCCLMPYRVFW